MDPKLSSNHKDEVHHVFVTQQTDSMFILTSHLKGYGRSDIKIEINEDGSRITISSEKHVEEVKCQVEMSIGFRKTFTIPEGVILDKVKARFDQDESKLTIRMPKSVKGIVEIGIQEIKDMRNPNHEEIVESSHLKQNQEDYKAVDTNEVQPDNKIPSQNEVFDEEKRKKFVNENENDNEEEKTPEKSSIICTPIIVGSTLFATLIVVVLSFFRSKNGSREKRD